MTNRALFGRPGERATGGRHRSKARLAAALLVMSAAALLSAIPAFADPSSISAKEAEVQSVLNQIDQLDASLERAVEAFNLANDKLDAIEGELEINARELSIAKANLVRSQKALSKRLVTIYTTGDQSNTTLGILLGAGSIDEMLSQIETVNRVSSQDVKINRQIVHFRAGSGSTASSSRTQRQRPRRWFRSAPTRRHPSSRSCRSATSSSPRSAARSSR